jgi:hypothetical protein
VRARRGVSREESDRWQEAVESAFKEFDLESVCAASLVANKAAAERGGSTAGGARSGSGAGDDDDEEMADDSSIAEGGGGKDAAAGASPVGEPMDDASSSGEKPGDGDTELGSQGAFEEDAQGRVAVKVHLAGGCAIHCFTSRAH